MLVTENKCDEIIEYNSKVSLDDPKAVEKIEYCIKQLEEKKVQVKARQHTVNELNSINKEIARFKKRIEQLKEIEKIDLDDLTFIGGKVERNKEINRIQIIFDEAPSKAIRIILNSKSFRTFDNICIWQKIFNKQNIYATKCVVDDIEKCMLR